MALATWWRCDTLPPLPPLAGFGAAVCDDAALLSRLNRITAGEVRARWRDGHRAYVAAQGGAPVAYGWVATRAAAIGELALKLALPVADRYLWDFATLPAWRGRGIYPRLLQAIMRSEAEAAERFWIIYAPENQPSGAGMRKAGFAPVAELSFDAGRQVRLAALGAPERARAAAALLGLALVGEPLAPCWCCQGGDEPACWPATGQPAHTCTCGAAP
ncbi:GNAT family N-acetyltransferase [Kouleothrix sp.]|uniref:GNAT family N-acetyltransferase n=1 Tax=Kouleothrix sp. TaxID=2779161 RepID=UPI00391DB9C0